MTNQLKTFPSIGYGDDLDEYGQIMNSRWYLMGLGPQAVLRWNQNNAQVAERIMRREWERRLGPYLVNTEVGIWMIQSLVQAAASEICGTWNALPNGATLVVAIPATWNWAAWAKFARWTAFLLPDQILELMGDINASRCERYAPYLVDVVIHDWFAPIDDDPWYKEPYVFQLPATGPYVFNAAPAGYAGTWSAPPDAYPPPTVVEAIPGGNPLPPESLPPGTELPPLPEGNLPPLPAGDPGAVAPVGYGEPAAAGDKKASTWQWLAAGALGLTGIGLVVATLASGRSAT